MTVSMGLMTVYFGPNDSIERGLNSQAALMAHGEFYYNDKDVSGSHQKLSFGAAFYDAYINYIPEFFLNVFYCGKGSSELAKKRARMRREKKMESSNMDTTALNP